jgi:uncharacterized protein (DUF1330 family)
MHVVGVGQCERSAFVGAYLINDVRMRDGVPNEEGLAQLKRTVETYCGRWLQRQGSGPAEGRRSSLILVEFATMTDAQRWYSSFEYERVSRVYVHNAIDLALTDEVGPDFTMAGFAQESPSSATWDHRGTYATVAVGITTGMPLPQSVCA